MNTKNNPTPLMPSHYSSGFSYSLVSHQNFLKAIRIVNNSKPSFDAFTKHPFFSNVAKHDEFEPQNPAFKPCYLEQLAQNLIRSYLDNKAGFFLDKMEAMLIQQNHLCQNTIYVLLTKQNEKHAVTEKHIVPVLTLK